MKTDRSSAPRIELAPGAEDNAFAGMLADLLRQNLASKPHKRPDFDRLRGSYAIVADDADIAVTLAFEGGQLTVQSGIRGVPDATIRGSADVIMNLSNLPLTRRLALPIPFDRASAAVLKEVAQAAGRGELRIFGMLRRFSDLSRLTRVLSVNG